VDVLEAREILRYKQANVERLNQMVATMRELLKRTDQVRPDLDRTAILRDTAEIELDAARSNLIQAQRALAVLLSIPDGDADDLAVRGAIRNAVPPPPPVDDLVKLAVCNRPDAVAYRRGVNRAMADVQLARRERFEDVFLFYTPYGFENYAYQGLKSATSWSLGGMVSLPLLNRNQGNIARAREGVIQARIELSGVERQVASEVRRAALDYETTNRAVRRFEGDILARARRQRDETYRLFVEGERNVSDYYNAERDYNDIVRQYYDSLIRHRRSMLRLNTAVGQRILP
jgi:cobalt-zinc-cadmium efflux system outer membrane protein